MMMNKMKKEITIPECTLNNFAQKKLKIRPK